MTSSSDTRSVLYFLTLLILLEHVPDSLWATSTQPSDTLQNLHDTFQTTPRYPSITYSRSRLTQIQHLSGTFFLGPDRKDSNASEYQKRPTTSTKICIRYCQAIFMPKIPFQLHKRIHKLTYFEMSVSAPKNVCFFRSNVPNRWGSS